MKMNYKIMLSGFLLFCTVMLCCKNNSNSKKAIKINLPLDSMQLIRNNNSKGTNSNVNSCDKEQPLLNEELTLSKLSIDFPQDSVLNFIGDPDSIGEERLGGVTNTYTQNWYYKRQGLVLDMHSETKNGNKRIRSILAEAPCTLKTKQCIGIGDSVNKLFKIYKNQINSSFSDTMSSVFVGSSYDGVIFLIKANVVDRIIFIGSAAN